MIMPSPAHRRYFRLAAIRAIGIGDAKVPQSMNRSSVGGWVGFEFNSQSARGRMKEGT